MRLALIALKRQSMPLFCDTMGDGVWVCACACLAYACLVGTALHPYLSGGEDTTARYRIKHIFYKASDG